MLSIFLSNLTCFELYLTTIDTPIQTCAQPPPMSTSFLNLEGFDEYLNEAMNLDSSFEQKSPNLFDCYFII